jgi:hypothetical protein
MAVHHKAEEKHFTTKAPRSTQRATKKTIEEIRSED